MDPERLRQIEDLYHAARECSESERQSLLDRADPELRNRVESLLAQDNLDGPIDRPMASVAAKVITGSRQFAPGDQLGSYRIDALLGAGGMGEVYRARDTTLKRDVALKVLPAAFAADPGRMMRFKREAEVLASLNHPHIAHLYGIQDRALVMELVDGKSPKGPMPFEDAWKVATQIAEALEYAHEKGVIHRDLKPANVKITPDGRVKLLDFGLAKALSPQARQSPENVENSPTPTVRETEAGVILGTAAYMAPEQAKGTGIDKRADIWSWGVMLYELVTGDRLFKGSDTASTLAQVLTKEPDLERVPPQIRKLLKNCLEKEPKQRLCDIGDARRLLDEADAVPTRSRFGAMGWIVAAMLAAVMAAALLLTSGRPAAHRLMRLTAALDAEIATDSSTGPAFAISADSSQLVYVSRDSNRKSHLSVRSLDRPNSTVLDGTEGAAAPFFSPDGRSIAFFADDKLKRIPVDGGTAIALSDAPYPYDGTWSEDGTIYFTSLRRLRSMPSSGGTAREATEPRPGEQAHRSAQLLPGGKAFLLTVSHTYGYGSGATIDVQVIKTGARKTLVNEAYFGRYLPTSKTSGYLLYVQGSTIFARPMNGERLEITGPAVPVLQDVPVRPQYGFAQFAVTPSGNVVYLASGDKADQLSLFWLDAAGNLQRLPASPAQYSYLSASPDGKRIALLITSGATNNLSVYEWAKNQMTQLTFQTGASRQGPHSSFLAWSPDGKHIAVAMDAREFNGPGIYWLRADGAAVARRLVEGTELSPYSFSPDGKHLAYTDWSHGYEIRTVALDLANPEIPKMGTPKLFLSSDRAVFVPNFSPDGRWIAYSSWETPRAELSVRPFHAAGPQAGARWQVSTAGIGGSSFWSPRNELFYQALDMRIYVAPYSVQGDAFVLGTPRLWSEKAPPILGAAPYLSMMPDGKRFIVALSAAAAEPQKQLTVLLNFGDWLRQQVPGAK